MRLHNVGDHEGKSMENWWDDVDGEKSKNSE
jgi:hypothetical protein